MSVAPPRTQSTTSLSKYYNGANGFNEEDVNDPRMDFCNAFWGPGEKGYEVLMARLRGANRTVEELRAFWKERIAIEEDYAKRLAKLSKVTLGKDEIGDLQGSLQNLLMETAQQATYHQSLSTELRQSVESPTAEFGNRLVNLKKGLQASIEKSYKNKGLQEGHVQKAKERYESDCLKLNSYTANSSLVQGKELDKVQQKLDRVRQTIGQNEQDFRQFVRVLEGTQGKWENEWKGFCDHVQDLEEDRLALTKDIIWAYANAVSQVCVEDDSSCERVREKLEQFEPQNDMLAFVRGWGTGDSIPDPQRFINYSAGEYPSQPTSHAANFRRISSKPPMPVGPSGNDYQTHDAPALAQPVSDNSSGMPNLSNGVPELNNFNNMHISEPVRSAPEPQVPEARGAPFGGIALPGMAPAAPPKPSTPSQDLPKRQSSMGPPPVPPTMTMPEPRIPSRQSMIQPDINDEEDPMARALANLRKEPPPPDSIRRNPSHRRPESAFSNAGSIRGGAPTSPGPAQGFGGMGSMIRPPSAASNTGRPPSQQAFNTPTSPLQNNRSSYQQHQGPNSKQSIDMTLSPPQGGHTAAALAKSMDEFHRQSSRDNRDSIRQSRNFGNYGDEVVGAHPTSRPASPSGRGPSPAMMQAPRQPPSPIQDQVLQQYHQAFPGERSRSRANSRANSIRSGRSRAGSVLSNMGAPQQPPQPTTAEAPATPRDGFAGIGARGRSPSPQPGAFRSPSPGPAAGTGGALGPQNIGISLDERGDVAHDSMAEAYRRQYQQQQQQSQQPPQQQQVQQPQQYGQLAQYNQQPQQYGQQVKSPVSGAYDQNRMSNLASPAPGAQQYGQQQQYGQHQQQQAPPPQQAPAQYYPAYDQSSQRAPQAAQPPYQAPPVQHQHSQSYSSSGAGGYQNPSAQYSGYQAPPQQSQYQRSASPAPIQQQPQSQYGAGGYRAPSPQPQAQPSQYMQQPQQQAMRGRSPSPIPGQVPVNAAPTGQWSTTGQPVLFYVKALYDYSAQSPAEFDFQAGDIIAVTSTPEDGWWSGELLDEARRLPGRNDFPSNFVCLF